MIPPRKTRNYVIEFIEKSKPKCKGILLDFDNTLYEYLPCHNAGLINVYKQIIQKEGISISFNKFTKLYGIARDSVKKNTKGLAACHSRLLYFQTLFESMFGHSKLQISLASEEAYWSAYIKEIRLYTWVDTLFSYAFKNRITIAMVTNLDTRTQFKKLIAVHLQDKFNYIVTSEEVGAEKPDTKVYELALAKLRLKPCDVVCIGDSKIEDGSAAERLKIPFLLVK